jgi:nucleotide-binding universal stress UspA family protein
MSYKTILLHLNDVRRARRLAQAGAILAGAFDSHLIGLHVFPAYRLTPPIPLPVGGNVIGRIKAHLREETDQIAAAFKDATVARPAAAEWRCITSERRDAALVVLEQGRAVDLIVASQSDPQWELSDVLDFPERLAIESGRPVLVVPNEATVPELPRRILVGWKPCREAARAVFDALPLLKAAEEVEVLTFDSGQPALEGQLPDTEIAAALARHGVDVVLASRQASDAAVGQELLRRASEMRADLLILGAYGHSRLRELAFGGVTRHVLREMTLPVLFSH